MAPVPSNPGYSYEQAGILAILLATAGWAIGCGLARLTERFSVAQDDKALEQCGKSNQKKEG